MSQNEQEDNGLHPDDLVVTRSDLKCGDLVKFDRIDTNRVQINALMIEELLVFPGRIYQIERTSTSDRIILKKLDPGLMYDP